MKVPDNSKLIYRNGSFVLHSSLPFVVLGATQMSSFKEGPACLADPVII